MKAKREPISAFVITYNEQDDIEECLKSISFCDEILVIDSFSTDETPELARQLGARVIQRAWPGHREQKAFGLAQVEHEWVLNIDADERVSQELRKEILEILCRKALKDDGVNGYSINRVVYHLGRWWRKGGWYPEYRLRFMRRSATSWGGMDPHEKALVEGPIVRLSGEIYHFSFKDLADQFSRLDNYSSVSAQELLKSGKQVSCLSIFFNPLLRMFKFYILRKGYREGFAGLVVALAEGYYTFMKYSKLWDLNQHPRKRQIREKLADEQAERVTLGH